MEQKVFTTLSTEELQTVIINCVNACLKTTNNSFKNQQLPDNPIAIKGASEITGLTVPTLYGYCQRNEIPYHKKGNRLYFFKSEIIEWIKTGKQKTLKELQREADIYLSNKNKGLHHGK